VCAKAGVEGHPHRFRDTFAVRLLEKGVPIDQVSTLLGHTSVNTTEKYYAPWVRSRQKLLDEAVAALDFVPAQLTNPRLKRVK
jgi:integrase